MPTEVFPVVVGLADFPVAPVSKEVGRVHPNPSNNSRAVNAALFLSA
jgi:hypothetical protein